MGRMIKGSWQTDEEMIKRTDDGEFDREQSSFHGEVHPDGLHEPAADRYHLYISRACPWAHRTMLVRALKGLESAISVDIVDPVRIDDGWEFSPEKADCTPDTVNSVEYLREIYSLADESYTGRVTVPVLWDRKEETIVNNESSEIIQIFDEGFEEFTTRDVSLFPGDQREQVLDTIDSLYESINNGVYKAGFAGSQEAYDRAVDELFSALEEYNELLGTQRYLCGERLTAADICLFPTLYRFDEVYHTHFMCNRKQVSEYEHLWNHTKECYGLPGVADTCNMTHCKNHYYRSHRDLNPDGIVPSGPNPDFGGPHDRDRFPGGPPPSLRN